MTTFQRPDYTALVNHAATHADGIVDGGCPACVTLSAEVGIDLG
jgi:hypothetical protein